MTCAIEAEQLRFAYPRFSADLPAPWVLDGLELSVEEGEWLAVMGANDSGKTTLCLLLAGLAPHLTGGQFEGKIALAGLDVLQHPPPSLAATVGLLFQEPESQLFNASVEAEVAWGLENLGIPRVEIRARVDQMLELLRLRHLRLRSPGDLSGGEKKRLALASVLAMRPKVLILDEPMGGLDPGGRSEVLEALRELRQDHSTTIVMTESDPEAVAAFADRLAVLREGRVAVEGIPRELFRQADRMATMGVAVPQMAAVAAGLNRRLGAQFDFLTVDEARAALGGQAEKPVLQGGQAEKPVLQGGQAGKPVLRVDNVWFSYGDGASVLRGIDLAVPSGQFVALVGANGSGKTTLVKHFNGLLRPNRGSVEVNGQDTAHRPVGELARHVGFLFQHPEQQIFGTAVAQELAFGPRNLGLPENEVQAQVDAALARFRLEAVADSPPAILGYGLRRRVTLATLAAMDPPIVVLDEPTVGLDEPGLRETLDWLAHLHSSGRTIVLVTHDMAVAGEYAERMVILDQGQIIADGQPGVLFGQPDLLARASLAPPPVSILAQSLRPSGLQSQTLTVEGFCDAYVALIRCKR